MLVFPNCKINLGLYVTEKRKDGFHNIETLFYPIQWTDAIEVIAKHKNYAENFTLHWPGQYLEIALEDQLVYKAWKLVNALKPLPPIDVYFMKNIPVGAGLGGGSSDGAHMINLLDQKFELNLNNEEKLKMAEKLGSDCPFFILNTPHYATGKGEVLSAFPLNLSSYYILLVYPGIHCNTALAYKSIQPKSGRPSIQNMLKHIDFTLWQKELVNDFEPAVFKQHPIIKDLKNKLYSLGARYASLSGSGSTVFGIFTEKPELQEFAAFRTYLQQPVQKVF
jgi:4-diphosphocytidyl-2-C-methyl-D-erythritol kinase